MTIKITDQHLQRGLQAARAGNKAAARQHLHAALEQSPQNTTAMCWLAFVSETPQESRALLEQVLRLNPANKNAQAGLRWVEQKAAAQRAATVPHPQPSPPATTQSAPEPAPAPPRRAIRPLAAALLLILAVVLIGVGAWALAFGPPQTLAAWLPLPAGSSTAQNPAAESPVEVVRTAPESAPQAVQPEAAAKPVAQRQHVSQSDTLARPVLPARNIPVVPMAAPDMPRPEPEETVAGPGASLVGAPPFELLGPVEKTPEGYEIGQPVDVSLLAHQPASPDEKWIEVNVTEQQVTAWEGNVPVFTFLTSTGLPNTPTVLGEYSIYWKLESTLMTGPGYYLPDVPYTMYFYRGYGLHGTYWHNNFGQPMSHGCVNLRNDNAQALFEWADPVIPPGQTQVTATADNPGTLVVVHE